MADILHPENVGHWELTEYGYTCSVCGYELNPKRGQTPDKADSCPFCAARMNEEVSEDECCTLDSGKA